MAHLAGVRLVRYSDPRQACGPPQFSIRDMFIWTTAVAVILARAWKCLPAGIFNFLHYPAALGIPTFTSFTLVSGF